MVTDQSFRDLMVAGVCAPVTVVTTAIDRMPHGATVNAFASPLAAPADGHDCPRPETPSCWSGFWRSAASG